MSQTYTVTALPEGDEFVVTYSGPTSVACLRQREVILQARSDVPIWPGTRLRGVRVFRPVPA